MVGVDRPLAARGLREQKKWETRQALKDAALELALAHGMDALTVDAISDAATVAPRTFFNYFACKEDALVAEPTQSLPDMQRMLCERPADEAPLGALRAVITQCDLFGAAHMDRERALARQRLVQNHPPLLARQLAQYVTVERAFAAALAERLGAGPEPDLRPELLAALAVSTVRVAMRRWSADGTRTLEEQVEAAFTQLEHVDLFDALPRHPA